MTNGKPIAHHGAAPAVYLQSFSEPSGKTYRSSLIQVLSKSNPKRTRISSISSVDTVNNQYIVKDLENIDPYSVEEGWNLKFEKPYGIVRKRIINGQWPLNPEDRMTLANFMTMCYVKDHRRLPRFRQIVQATARTTAEDLNIPKMMVEDILGATEKAIDGIGLIHLQNRVQHYAKVFALRHKWMLLRSATPLFTGNTPLSILNKVDDKMTFHLEYGIKRFDMAFFPISRKIGIMFRSHDPNGNFTGDYPRYAYGEYDSYTRRKSISTAFRSAILASSDEIYTHPKDLPDLIRLQNWEDFYLPTD